MIAGILQRFRYYRHAEVPPDHAGDLSKRSSLVAAEPTNPLAPVTKIRIPKSPRPIDVSCCHAGVYH